MITIGLIWLVCGLISSLVTYYFVTRDTGVITVGDLAVLIILLILGPVGLLLGIITLLVEWVSDNSGRVIYERRKGPE